jgi:S-DNA-T family DNA segregation ATPase FtsK/SpoIIIE
MVYDGEVVDEAAATTAGAAAASPDGPGRPRTAPAIARHAGYVAAGAVVAWRRWRHRRTRHERMMRTAELSGDKDALQWWEEHRLASRREARERWRTATEVIVTLVKVAPWVIGITALAPGALGILLAFDHHNLLWTYAPYLWAAHAAGTAVEVASVALTAAEWAALPAVVLGLWQLGRTGGSMAPSWTVAARPEEEGRGLVVTADTIVIALQHVPVTALAKAMKDGWKPVFHLQPVREGHGYAAVFEPPLGVTPAMIADQRAILARNLHRDMSEVWPSDAAAAKGSHYPAGSVAVWVADPGVLSRPTPEYPLLHEGAADVFKGVPGGVTARGDARVIPVVANNFVAGGQQGQGKSNLCRVMILGCCLDPLCVVDVLVFAGNGDFDAYAPRLNVYRKGATDETVAAAVARLEWFYEEVSRREARLAELGAKKLTRRIAEEHPNMRPHVALFSECHELFGHPEHGARATELAVKTIKRSRKTGIVFGFDTQSSRKEAIPPALVELVSVNACFYVKTWRSNDGFLGDGSFQAGIRATELRPGRDIGRSVVTGISDAQFELLKWYLIFNDDDTGQDDATEVIARAMKMLAPGTPAGATLALPAAEPPRDLLADLAEVTRDDSEPARLSVLAVRLKDLAKTWGPYRQLTGVQLAELLDAEGVRWTNAKNVPRLDLADLRRALAERGELGDPPLSRECAAEGCRDGWPNPGNRPNISRSRRSGACEEPNPPGGGLTREESRWDCSVSRAASTRARAGTSARRAAWRSGPAAAMRSGRTGCSRRRAAGSGGRTAGRPSRGRSGGGGRRRGARRRASLRSRGRAARMPRAGRAASGERRRGEPGRAAPGAA